MPTARTVFLQTLKADKAIVYKLNLEPEGKSADSRSGSPVSSDLTQKLVHLGHLDVVLSASHETSIWWVHAERDRRTLEGIGDRYTAGHASKTDTIVAETAHFLTM